MSDQGRVTLHDWEEPAVVGVDAPEQGLDLRLDRVVHPDGDRGSIGRASERLADSTFCY